MYSSSWVHTIWHAGSTGFGPRFQWPDLRHRKSSGVLRTRKWPKRHDSPDSPGLTMRNCSTGTFVPISTHFFFWQTVKDELHSSATDDCAHNCSFLPTRWREKPIWASFKGSLVTDGGCKIESWRGLIFARLIREAKKNDCHDRVNKSGCQSVWFAENWVNYEGANLNLKTINGFSLNVVPFTFFRTEGVTWTTWSFKRIRWLCKTRTKQYEWSAPSRLMTRQCRSSPLPESMVGKTVEVVELVLREFRF